MLLVMNTAGGTVYITVLLDFFMVALFDFVFATLLMYFACKYSKRLFILYSSLGSAADTNNPSVSWYAHDPEDCKPADFNSDTNNGDQEVSYSYLKAHAKSRYNISKIRYLKYQWEGGT